jgi:hypothetical protein
MSCTVLRASDDQCPRHSSLGSSLPAPRPAWLSLRYHASTCARTLSELDWVICCISDVVSKGYVPACRVPALCFWSRNSLQWFDDVCRQPIWVTTMDYCYGL